jgi:hypothetical protein
MAVTASGVYGQTLLDTLDASALAINLVDNTNNFHAMITDSATPDFSDTTPYFQAGGQEKDNEVSGTGYTAGGKAAASQTATISTGTLTWDAADTAWTSSTISNAMAAVIYDNGETNDDLILLSDFVTAASSSSGTFTIQWHANGIMTIDYTP